LIQYPAALQVLDFADGQVQLVAVKPYFGGAVVGKSIAELYKAIPNIKTRVITIYRGNKSIEISPETIIEVGDEVFFIASNEDVLTVMSSMRRLDRLNKRIMIAGGGNIGYRLAGALEGEYQVKIIEFNVERAEYISEKLSSATVLQGNASDKDLLLSENIEHMDVFCALTNDDEANIMSALLAKRMGAKQVVALVTRSAYIELIEGGAIDIAISPQQAIIGSILTHLRKGDIVNVYSLRRGAAEALEIIAHGDEKTSKVVGKKTEDLNLPPGATIAAIIRGERVIIDVAGISIEPGDHTIILVADKKHIHDVEKLFQVSVGYFK
jgi:trk system potassium uptake protein TrkA